MARKKGGKSKGVVSKGERNNVSKKLSNSMRTDYLKTITRTNNQMAAHRAGKKVMLTIANPDKSNTKERFIKVPASEVW